MQTRYIMIWFTGAMVLFTSCTKFLDQQPNSTATDQTTWKSDGDANASVAACYSLIRSAFDAAITYYSYGDLTSDEFDDVTGGDLAYRDIQQMNWGVGIPSANNYDPRLKLRLFTNFYTGIAQSNRCLHFINNMSVSLFNGSSAGEQQARKNHLLGEAYFTRAFNYFYIARVWGDAPLVTEYYADNATAPQLPRSPQSQLLAQCISDLNQAKQFLDWRDFSSQDQVVRADKGAVFALMAHLYAWKGNYDSCAMACDSVIDGPTNGKYGLVDGASYMDLYKGQSKESVFEIAQNTQGESMKATDAYSLTGVLLTPNYINNFAPNPYWEIDPGNFNYLYNDPNDVRLQAFTTSSGGAIECIKYANIQNLNSSSTYQVAMNNILVFRLADIKLLRAEALAAKTAPDEAGALSEVNDVRTRAGLSPLTGLTGLDLLAAILDERGRELFLEGHRFYDMVRLGRLGIQAFTHMTPTEFQLGKYYWPIDPSLFFINSKLTQTSFWSGKIK